MTQQLRTQKFDLLVSIRNRCAHYQMGVKVLDDRAKAVRLSVQNRPVWLPKAALKETKFDGHFVGYELAKWFKMDDYQNSVLFNNTEIVD